MSLKKPHLTLLDLPAPEPILRRCESPIELQFGDALYYNWCDHALHGVIFPAGTEASVIRLFLESNYNLEGSNFQFGFAPQVPVAGFRVDFLVVGQGMPDSEPMLIAVECDGHDFHEKTKEQAARDKARDRAIVRAGYYIMRFTGAEIWRDAEGCAQQVVDAIEGYWDRDFEKSYSEWERQQGATP